MGEIRYMISETAKQVDVEAHVLRYWEEELSLPIDRNEMGHRYYTEDDISLFKNIKELKEQGFQLKAIKMLLPELRKKGGFNMDRLLEKKEELNRAAESAFRQDALETYGGAAKSADRACTAGGAGTADSCRSDVRRDKASAVSDDFRKHCSSGTAGK